MVLWFASHRQGMGVLFGVERTGPRCFDDSERESSGMVPVKKTSKCRKRKRRSHQARRPAVLVACPKCGKAKLPHCACSSCGFVSAKLMLPIHEEEG